MRPFIHCAIAALAVVCSSPAQTITTLAGTLLPAYSPFSGPATNAPIGVVYSVAVGPDGTVYGVDFSNNVIFAVAADGSTSVIAGNGGFGFSGDGGPASQAVINNVESIRVDAAGNLYLADAFNNRVRKISNGIITTIAGNGTFGFSGDNGPATSAAIGAPYSLAVDSTGNVYVGDEGNHRIRKVSANGTITTIAGSGVLSDTGDGGPATSAGLASTDGLAYDPASGYIYISERASHKIRRFKEGGAISTFAGTGVCGFAGDNGLASAATLCLPEGIAVDASGNLYIADYNYSRIRKITAATGVITTVAGATPAGIPSFSGYAGDGGAATSAYLGGPEDLAIDSAGNLYIADQFNFRIRKVTNGTISTFAGNGNYHFFGDGGLATSALLNQARALAVDSIGNVYVADSYNNRVRKIDPVGNISTYAGTGIGFSTGDGSPPTQAQFGFPNGLLSDSIGNLYVSDANGDKVRKIVPGGVVTTIAGNGTGGFSGDGGPATAAQMASPGMMAADSAGNIYVVDTFNNRIRKIATDGTISTVAGNGSSNSTGDGGLATSASFFPRGIAVDATGSLYISDSANNRIRKVTNGKISTFAGTGFSGSSGDGGLATSAALSAPAGLAFDSAGNLYVCVTAALRKITPQGIISRVAGNGTSGTTGDGGPPLNAEIGCYAVTLDGAGNIYVADGNYRVRKITVQASTVSTVSVTPTAVSLTAQQGAVTTSPLAVSSTPGGLAFQVTAATTGGTWLSVSPSAGATPATITITANAASLAVGVYQGTVTIQSSTASPPTTVVNVTFTVTAGPAGRLSATPPSLQVQSGGTQTIVLSNSAATAQSFTASASTSNGASWLSVSPHAGSVSALGFSQLAVAINTQGLTPGAYSGTIGINNFAIDVPVELVIPPSGAAMVVSQSGLVFTTVAGSPFMPTQQVYVANTGTAILPWTSAVVRGAPFGASPAGPDMIGAGTYDILTVSANPSLLQPGSYYGLIQVAAAGAANSPQFISTVFNVLPVGSTPLPRIYPQGIIITNTTTIASLGITIGSLSPTSAVVSTQSGGNWLSVDAPGGALITVQRDPTGLAPGVYKGTVTILVAGGAPPQDVAVTLIVPPNSSVGAESSRGAGATACTPSKLVLAMRQLANNFSSPAGWPVNLEASLADDCGNAVNGGTVVATFSNGDPALSLPSLGSNGLYAATWKAGNVAATAVTVSASSGTLTPAVVVLTGNVGANAAPPPVIGSGGVVNGASFAPGLDLAPGSIVSVFGANLGTANTNASAFPLPTTLANIKLTIGGIDAPLFFSSTGQVNAQLPFELTPGTQSQVIARAIPASGAELDGVPEPIVVGAAHPGIFTTNGTQGAILNVANQLIDATHPATAGDAIVIFCTGLGAVTPAASTGQPTASGTVAVQPTVMIGGAPAVIQYAGVAPGFVGLYQVNAVVPTGLGVNASANVVIIQNGFASNAGTIAVR